MLIEETLTQAMERYTAWLDSQVNNVVNSSASVDQSVDQNKKRVTA
ncbi:MAG: hypothetical protein GY795_31990 [Desulfobacterales bacterium]|nr:hypothetical protein [Desulfobacterales bacterium]